MKWLTTTTVLRKGPSRPVRPDVGPLSSSFPCGHAAIVALGIAVAAASGVFSPGDGDPTASPEPVPRRENDDERLMTRIDGEAARLLVHVQPVDEDAPDAAPPP